MGDKEKKKIAVWHKKQFDNLEAESIKGMCTELMIKDRIRDTSSEITQSRTLSRQQNMYERPG